MSETTKGLFEGVSGYKSDTFMIPENYYNIRASNGYLSFESQKTVERNIGNVIKPENYYNGGRNIFLDGEIRARNYLTQRGMPAEKIEEVINSFQKGTIKISQAGEHEYGIRYFDVLEGYNGATATGQYLNNTFTPLTNRANLALPPSWNKAYYIQQWQIKPGTVMLTGRVGPQFEYGSQYVGGAVQTFVYQPWLDNSLIMPDW